MVVRCAGWSSGAIAGVALARQCGVKVGVGGMVALPQFTDEVKDIRDKAEAMRAYAHQAKNRQMEIDAAEIRIRAERRLGELIVAQKESVGLATGAAGIGKPESAVPDEYRTQPPTLADVGIDKKLSSHAQKVASIPEAEFEGIVGEWWDGGRLSRVAPGKVGGSDTATEWQHPSGWGNFWGNLILRIILIIAAQGFTVVIW